MALLLTLTCGFSAEFLPERRSKHELESKSTLSTAMVRLRRTRLLVVDPVELSFTTYTCPIKRFAQGDGYDLGEGFLTGRNIVIDSACLRCARTSAGECFFGYAIRPILAWLCHSCDTCSRCAISKRRRGWRVV